MKQNQPTDYQQSKNQFSLRVGYLIIEKARKIALFLVYGDTRLA